MQDCRIRRAKVVLTILAMKLPSLRLLIIRLARYIILNTKLSDLDPDQVKEGAEVDGHAEDKVDHAISAQKKDPENFLYDAEG